MAKFNIMLVDDPLTPTTPEQREAMRVWWENRRREMMKALLHKHKINSFNHGIEIEVEGSGDPMTRGNTYHIRPPGGAEHIRIPFQDGPVKEAGVNGISDEVLIAIVLHRLECFQAGPYKCRQNALAITKLEEALHWLQDRTAERERRGVEGTSKV